MKEVINVEVGDAPKWYPNILIAFNPTEDEIIGMALISKNSDSFVVPIYTDINAIFDFNKLSDVEGSENVIQPLYTKGNPIIIKDYISKVTDMLITGGEAKWGDRLIYSSKKYFGK